MSKTTTTIEKGRKYISVVQAANIKGKPKTTTTTINNPVQHRLSGKTKTHTHTKEKKKLLRHRLFVTLRLSPLCTST